MSQGARNWPFLTLIARPVSAAAAQQVGLAAEEGRDLEHVDHLGHRPALPALVDVGEHGHAQRLADLGQDREPLLQAERRGRSRHEVRFALSNELLKISGMPEPAGDRLELGGDGSGSARGSRWRRGRR